LSKAPLKSSTIVLTGMGIYKRNDKVYLRKTECFYRREFYRYSNSPLVMEDMFQDPQSVSSSTNKAWPYI
jgi:hypothetical protein